MTMDFRPETQAWREAARKGTSPFGAGSSRWGLELVQAVFRTSADEEASEVVVGGGELRVVIANPTRRWIPNVGVRVRALEGRATWAEGPGGESILERTGLEVRRTVASDAFYPERPFSAAFFTRSEGSEALSTEVILEGKRVLQAPAQSAFRIAKTRKSPAPPRLRPRKVRRAPIVFLSYCRSDDEWLTRLRKHLEPLVRDDRLDVWDDTRLLPGEPWQEQIERQLGIAAAAVLLVSAGFLASDFIARVEVPALLGRAKQRGVVILPVILSHCLYKESALGQLQAVNSPDRPLIELPPARQDAELVALARRILDALGSVK